jgi:hypothetical protein
LIGHLNATRRARSTRSGLRKLRLFLAACCRRGWDLLEHDPVRPVLEAAERHADGACPASRLVRLIRAADAVVKDSLPSMYYVEEEYFYSLLRQGHLPRPIDHLRLGVLCIADPGRDCDLASYYLSIAHGVAGRRLISELSAQCAILRDVFGDPFRPIAFKSEWRTEAAVLLARQMYDSRDFGAMPILADALQEAGCDSEAILSHCRDPKQVHVRGCWVVDAVLGRK